MKKLCLFLFLSVASVSVVMAQPRSIGLRLGGNQELTFQQYVNSESNFVQLDAGSFYFRGLQVTVTYNWLSHSLNNPNFSVYGGLGAALGYNWGDNAWYHPLRFADKNDPAYAVKWANRVGVQRYFFTGVVGHLGIEYKFDDVPISISLDYRPLIGIDFGKEFHPITNEYSDKIKIGYHTPGLWAFALSGRYFF